MANTPNLDLENLNLLNGNDSAYKQIEEIVNKSNANNLKMDKKFVYATQAEAEAGADNTKIVTPLKVRQFFNANGGISGGTLNYVFQSGKRYWVYTAISVVNSVTIPIEQFNPETDIFDLVNDDNILLIKDVNYTLVGNLVTLAGFNLEIGEKLHFLITNSSYSYNALSDKPINNGVLGAYKEKLTTLVSGNIDLNNGNIFVSNPATTTTYTISNAVANVAHSFTLIINQPSTAVTLNFPASVKWQEGNMPDMSVNSKTYLLTFLTIDGGVTWLGMYGGKF